MENLQEYKLLEGEYGSSIKLQSFTEKNIINSYGGDLYTGFASYDFLKGIPNSEVVAMGVCASSATISLVGASKRIGTKNSKFCIHNPIASPKGDADKLMRIAIKLKEEENNLVSIYVNELSISEEEIRAKMADDEPFDIVEAKRIGLIHEVIEDDFTPTTENTSKELYFNFLNQKEMSEKQNVSQDELKTELKNFEDSFLGRIKNLFNSKVENILLKDVNGSELDFDVETEDQIAVGTSATVDGSSASGEYVMASGETYVFKDGVVAEIKPAEDEEGDEMEALKAENEALKAKIAESETASAESETTIQNLKAKVGEKEELEKKLAEFTNAFSGKISNLSTPEGKEEKTEKSNKAFKSNKRIKI